MKQDARHVRAARNAKCRREVLARADKKHQEAEEKKNSFFANKAKELVENKGWGWSRRDKK